MNPRICVAPDGKVIRAARHGKLQRLIKLDVGRRTPKELHELLVADAVKRQATDVRWALAAYLSIAARDRCSKDEAFIRVVDEVTELTGLPLMPGTLP